MNKTKILIILLLVLLVLAFFVAVSTRPKSPDQLQSPSPIIQFIRPSLAPSVSPATDEFKIINTIPDLEKQKLLRIDQGLVVVFSKPINPAEIIYEITPQTRTISELSADGTKFTIRGDPFWPKDASFKLVIKAQTKSYDNLNLDKDYTFDYSTGLLEGIQ